MIFGRDIHLDYMYEKVMKRMMDRCSSTFLDFIKWNIEYDGREERVEGVGKGRVVV